MKSNYKMLPIAIIAIISILISSYVFSGVLYSKTTATATPDEELTATPDTVLLPVDTVPIPNSGATEINNKEEKPTSPTEVLEENLDPPQVVEIPYKDNNKKPTSATPTEETDTAPENSGNNNSDTELLAKLIYLEAGSCSEMCQWLVGSTAMNLADANGGLSSVAYNYNMFNVAYLIDGCTPSSTSRKVAAKILNGDRDYNVKAFRTDYYHGFGKPYKNIDNVYFSTY